MRREASIHEVDIGVRTTVIDYTRSNLLNADSAQGNINDILSVNEPNIAVVSEADQELIVNVAFKDPVTIHSVQILSMETPADDSTSGPKNVALYANRDLVDFSEVLVVPPDQTFQLTKDNLTSTKHKMLLKGARFQKCNSVQVYISTNQNDTEKTCVTHVKFFGFVCPSSGL